SHVMDLQRNGAQAAEYGTYEALGFGYEVVDQIPQWIRGVTKEQMMAVAKQVFDAKRAVIVKMLPEERLIDALDWRLLLEQNLELRVLLHRLQPAAAKCHDKPFPCGDGATRHGNRAVRFRVVGIKRGSYVPGNIGARHRFLQGFFRFGLVSQSIQSRHQH